MFATCAVSSWSVFMSNAVPESPLSRRQSRQMKARTWFCCEAIKKEEELSIAPSKINIYIQQDEPLFVPPTSLLVAVASKISKFVLSQPFFVWMPSQQDGNWSKEEKMSEFPGDNDEDSPYGYSVPERLVSCWDINWLFAISHVNIVVYLLQTPCWIAGFLNRAPVDLPSSVVSEWVVQNTPLSWHALGKFQNLGSRTIFRQNFPIWYRCFEAKDFVGASAMPMFLCQAPLASTCQYSTWLQWFGFEYSVAEPARTWACWQCLQNHWSGCWTRFRWFEEGADIHFVLWVFFIREMTKLEQTG